MGGGSAQGEDMGSKALGGTGIQGLEGQTGPPPLCLPHKREANIWAHISPALSILQAWGAEGEQNLALMPSAITHVCVLQTQQRHPISTT